MPVNPWKNCVEVGVPYTAENDIFDDYEDIFGDVDVIEKNLKPMKNIFFNTKIKKQKITKELLNRLEFASIKNIMDTKDGSEAYLGAYSESEYYAYRFQKIHGFTPDVIKIQNVKTQKFLSDFFKNVSSIPSESYYKTYELQRGESLLNLFFIGFHTGREDRIYLYLDNDEATIFYNKKDEKNENSAFYLLISLLNGYIEPKVNKNKIYVVYQTQNGFEKTGFDVKRINVNLEENYNDGFGKVSEEIVSGLNDKKKTNLVILRGAPGTGKTTYIRYLTSKIKKNIIFIAPDMVNHITDPSFIPFLIKNNDAVLIIEDAEPALQSREGNGGRTGAVSNVLNLTDGLLSDCLNISIVATFNTQGKDIDKALLRKGRLLKNYNFDRLNVKKSKALLEKLGKPNIEVSEPMTLAEIYYHGEDNNSEEYKSNKIGFKN